VEFHYSLNPIILKGSYQNCFTLKTLNVVFLLIRTYCYPECSTKHTESYIVLFLLCFLLFRISPPVCILWQLQDLILFEWNYLLCWLWNNTVWRFITWAPISAVTNSQSVDQTVRVRIRFGTAGDLRRSITVHLYESFMFYKQYTYA